ncbi:MAG: translation initiation factor IF-3 [Oscillospiraceae bacterium]|nr:translation initiation factor IF-3 [Oscillospiraceae bacterium]
MEVSHISSREQQINDAIRDREIRVVSESGEQLGIMSSAAALQLAERQNLDLVKIAPMAKPPVCKIMDYGKFRFEQSRREKEAHKNQRVVEVKPIRISPRIDKHDFDTKVAQALRFLERGNKVQVFLQLRGREMTHADLARKTMTDFQAALSGACTVESAPKLDGRKMLMILAAKAKAPETKSAAKPAADES